MKNLLLFLLLNFVLSIKIICAFKCTSPKGPILIVISLDGFRNEYLTRNITPNIQDFRDQGVHIRLLKTLRQSNAFATHHTIATGYKASIHKVTGHHTWAAAMGGKPEREYCYGSDLYGYTSSTILPIWTLNQNNGGRSGCIMWPGCEFEYDDKRVSYLMQYNSSILIIKRFATVVEWLNSSLTPPNLIMVYMEDPDRTAHIYGPDSQEVNDKLKEIDNAQKYFYDKIYYLKMKNRVHIIYLSDHSMYPVQYKDFVDSEAQLENLCKATGLYGYKYFLDCQQQELVYPSSANATACNDYASNTFTRTLDYTIPEHIQEWSELAWNYAYYTQSYQAWGECMKKYVILYEKETGNKADSETIFGAHGYLKDKDVLFMAQGPAFVTGYVNTEIHMDDFHKLFTYILRIDGDHEHAGNFTRVLPLLQKKPPKQPRVNWIDIFIVIMICAIFHCAIFYFGVNFYVSKKKKAKAARRQKKIQRAQEKLNLANN